MGHLAGVLRSLRVEAALTQEELAERAELSVRTVSDIERGLRKRLYRVTAARLGVALGLEESSLADFVELASGRSSDLKRELDG
ncbi:MAG: helix-turn-helix transcriptional regulator, partial [Marmoricola sp.]